MDQLLIVQVEPPQRLGGGDYYYRAYSPGISMSEQEGIYVVNVTGIHQKRLLMMQKADVLILNGICNQDLYPIIKERRENGRVTVYEIGDDFTDVQPWNPVYDFFQSRENQNLWAGLARTCDALQFSTEQLYHTYQALHNRKAIFPNQMLNIPPLPKKNNNGICVIGWGGSLGHLQDVAEVADALIDWVIDKKNTVLHLMCAREIGELFSRLPAEKKRLFHPGTITDYYEFLKTLDIGIIPLQDTGFNRNRSDVKFLEYAAHGVVPVVKRTKTYQTVRDGDTGFFYDKVNELIHVLNTLLYNRGLREKVAQSARNYIASERLERQKVKSRIDFYRNLFPTTNSEDRCHSLFDEIAKTPGASRKGRYINFSFTDYERLIIDGLFLLKHKENHKIAKNKFEQAMKLQPDEYQPLLMASVLYQDPLPLLKKALQLYPSSIHAWMLMGQHFTGRGNPIAALKCFEKAAQIFPDYEQPYLKSAQILKMMGKTKEADLLFQKANKLSFFPYRQ